MKKLLCVLLISIFYGCASSEKATHFFERAEYELAIKHYKNLLNQKTENKGKIHFKIAESYRLSNRIKDAFSHYLAAMKSGYKSNKLNFFVGYAAKANGKYDTALAYFQKYIENTSNATYLEQAQNEVQNLKDIEQILGQETHTSISACDQVNTKASEFAPMIYDNKLIFSSSKRGEKIFHTDGTGFTDLYAVQIEDTTNCRIKKIAFFNTKINTDGRHEANTTFSQDGKTMIFARSNSANKNEKQKDVNLYISTRGNSVWSSPKMLNISRKKAWDSSPALSPDGKTLYFSSNRSEQQDATENHLDLYKSTKDEQGNWGEPQRLNREINTNANELFPYMDQHGNFYFASDGHRGLGQLDLFKVDTVGQEKKLVIKNLGKPINSTSDDFGIVFRNPSDGYFSSNRSGNDDIYQFHNDSSHEKLVVYYLRGTSYVHKGRGKEILPETTVKLMDDTGKILESKVSGQSGKFQFDNPIDIDKKYHLIGEKTDYVSDDFDYSTFGRGVVLTALPVGKNIIYFDTTLVLEKDIFSGDTIPELEILYEYDKTRITKQAGEKLDEFAYFLTKYIRQHPNVIIELGSHTDARGNAQYNERLAEGRAKSAVSYLMEKGINADNIKAKGYGEYELKIKNAKSEEEHQANRRTTVKILK